MRHRKYARKNSPVRSFRRGTPLPFDIHTRIIQFVYILSQSHDVDYRTLSACALVCKQWAAPEQRLLFRRLPRPSNTGDDDSGPYLRHAGPLESSPRSPSPARTSGHTGDTVSLPLLRYCPHIAQLRLVGELLPSVQRVQDLRELGLHPSVLVFAAPVEPDVLHAVLATLPSVRHLVMEQAAGNLELKLPPSSQLLSIKFFNAIDFDKLCMLPAPTVPADISFQDLHLGYLHFPGNMTSVERGVARNLRSLTAWMVVPSNDTLEQLTALESLVINKLPSEPLVFPRTLRHFGFHAQQDYGGFQSYGMARSLRELAASLSESALPELRLVTVTRCSEQYVRHALEEASTARGTEFVEYPNVEAYPGRFF
ncbi:hypothetical protein FA95DRAFT_1559496 [Auriscalpium vulgare]|uniref:Uncharacterized protein n=1 Tax=Auriscalpium vulgare TaxID=40419 RepID=A0ACB8RTB2_9AGAM|nr:hypothetical protein FA95DRAFT_1559496 [Auriscalpium vulgare]